jgi:branched-chain amino acid aminotransferase
MLALNVPFSNNEIAAELEKTMSAASLEHEAYIRILLTRGVGDLTYDPRDTPKPSLVIIVKNHIDPLEEVYQDGINVVITKVVRNHPSTVNPKIKSNNLLNSALAMQEAIRRGAFEGVMRNYRGELAECTTANLFIVRKDVAITPPVEAGLLPGITRAFLFEISKDTGIVVKEAILKDADLFNADEAFLTSTTRELVPIVKVDRNKIGNGSPGPITKKLLQAFRVRARAT